MNELNINMSDNILKVSLPSEIDHHSAKNIRDKIDEALYLYRPSALHISLENVLFMDSSGLGLILGRYTKAQDIGASVKLINPDRRTEKILSFAGVEKIIPIERDAKF